MMTNNAFINAIDDHMIKEVTSTLSAYQKANILSAVRRDPASALYRMDACYVNWHDRNVNSGRSCIRDIPFLIQLIILNQIARNEFLMLCQINPYVSLDRFSVLPCSRKAVLPSIKIDGRL